MPTEYDLEEGEFVGELSSYYRQELQAAGKDYKQVVMLGDSMGASAALLFSPLATSVIAFCPQVYINGSICMLLNWGS